MIVACQSALMRDLALQVHYRKRKDLFASPRMPRTLQHHCYIELVIIALVIYQSVCFAAQGNNPEQKARDSAA